MNLVRFLFPTQLCPLLIFVIGEIHKGEPRNGEEGKERQRERGTEGGKERRSKEEGEGSRRGGGGRERKKERGRTEGGGRAGGSRQKSIKNLVGLGRKTTKNFAYYL